MNNDNQQNMININWYPGHMAKAKRQIDETLNLVDIVYELVDARIPYSSKIDDGTISKDKPKILIMTKYDMCDKAITDKWIFYYKNKGYYVLTIDLINDRVDKIVELTTKILRDKLMMRQEKGINSNKIRALVLGCPNVGKSTLINRLGNRKATQTGNRAGVTKQVSWIKVNDRLEILDTPGILYPKLENQEVALNLASMTAIKEEVIPKDDVAVHIIKKLKKIYPEKLKTRYDLENIVNLEDVYDAIGRKRGCLLRGGETDYDRVTEIILNDIKDGSIKNVTFDVYDEKMLQRKDSSWI